MQRLTDGAWSVCNRGQGPGMQEKQGWSLGKVRERAEYIIGKGLMCFKLESDITESEI